MSFTFAMGGVTFYEPEFDHFKNSPTGEIGQYLHKKGTRILIQAKVQVGKDTNQLMHSIYFIHERIGLYQELRIGSEDDIALIHHEGTRPHTINARGTGTLRFAGTGRMVYTRMIDHPGTKPNRYLSDNLRLAYV